MLFVVDVVVAAIIVVVIVAVVVSVEYFSRLSTFRLLLPSTVLFEVFVRVPFPP